MIKKLDEDSLGHIEFYSRENEELGLDRIPTLDGLQDRWPRLILSFEGGAKTEFSAVKDAYVKLSSPRKNQGAEYSFRVRRGDALPNGAGLGDASPYRALIAFNESAIATEVKGKTMAGQALASAKLRLCVERAAGPGLVGRLTEAVEILRRHLGSNLPGFLEDFPATYEDNHTDHRWFGGCNNTFINENGTAEGGNLINGRFGGGDGVSMAFYTPELMLNADLLRNGAANGRTYGIPGLDEPPVLYHAIENLNVTISEYASSLQASTLHEMCHAFGLGHLYLNQGGYGFDNITSVGSGSGGYGIRGWLWPSSPAFPQELITAFWTASEIDNIREYNVGKPYSENMQPNITKFEAAFPLLGEGGDGRVKLTLCVDHDVSGLASAWITTDQDGGTEVAGVEFADGTTGLADHAIYTSQVVPSKTGEVPYDFNVTVYDRQGNLKIAEAVEITIPQNTRDANEFAPRPRFLLGPRTKVEAGREFSIDSGISSDPDNDWETTSATFAQLKDPTIAVTWSIRNAEPGQPVPQDIAFLDGASSATLTLKTATPGTYIIQARISDGSYAAESMPIGVTVVEADRPRGFRLNVVKAVVEEDSQLRAAVEIELDQDTPPGISIPIRVETRGETATSGIDFVPVDTTVVFAPGEKFKLITLPIIDDQEIELDETFSVVLSSSTGAPIVPPGSQTLTILDDDREKPAIALSQENPLLLEEGAGTVQMSAVLSEPVAFPIRVDLRTVPQTASDFVEFLPIMATLEFQPGETAKTFALTLLSDPQIEPLAKTLKLALSNPVSCELGSPNEQIIRIQDVRVIDFEVDGSQGWMGGVLGSGGGSTSTVGGLCMSVPLTGENVVGWVSPDGYVQLTDNTLYRVRLTMATDQTLPDRIPMWAFAWDNLSPIPGSNPTVFTGNTYGGEARFRDVEGGANGIGRSNGRSIYQVFIAPNAIRAKQWRGTTGIADIDCNSAFTPAADPFNDMRFFIRLLDQDSAGIGAELDEGTICLQRLQIDAVSFDNLQVEEMLFGPAITPDTHEAFIDGQTPENIGCDDPLAPTSCAIIDEEQPGSGIFAANYRLKAPNDRMTLIPVGYLPPIPPSEEPVPDPVKLFPVVWRSGELLMGTMTIRSDFNDGILPPEGYTPDPPDIIGPIFDTANSELSTLHFSDRGSLANMHFAASPTLLSYTTEAQPYISFFFTQNETESLDLMAHRLRMVGDFHNRIDIDGELSGREPFTVETMKIERVSLPVFPLTGLQGMNFSAPQALNATAPTDTADSGSGEPIFSEIRTDRAGTWLALWNSEESLGGTLGSDRDLFSARYVQPSPGGFTPSFSFPVPAHANADTDTGDDGLAFTYIDLKAMGDGLGTWVAVWTSNEPTAFDAEGAPISVGIDPDIFVSCSHDNGASWSLPMPLNTTAATDGDAADFNPQIATDGSGTWLAIWQSRNLAGGPLGKDYDLFVARSSDSGHHWTPPVSLNTTAATDRDGDGGPSDDDVLPRLATDGTGTWLVAWTLAEGVAPKDVLTARSTDDGDTWTEPVSVLPASPPPSAVNGFPSLATDGLGVWTVLWNSQGLVPGLGTDFDILYARSVNDGASWSVPSPLNSNAATDTSDDGITDLAAGGAGEWRAVWTGTLAGGDADILVSRSLNHGASWSAVQPLQSHFATDTGTDDIPRIATDGMGRWLVTWSSTDDLAGTIGDDWDILYSYDDENAP